MIGIFLFTVLSDEKEYSPLQDFLGSGESNYPLLFFIARLNSYGNRGRWLLFGSIFLVVMELFIFLFYGMGMKNGITAIGLPWLMGAAIYFVVLVFCIALSGRLISMSNLYSGLSGVPFLGQSSMQEKIDELNNEQRNQLLQHLISRAESLEKIFLAASVMLTVAVTLFLVWALSLLSKVDI